MCARKSCQLNAVRFSLSEQSHSEISKVNHEECPVNFYYKAGALLFQWFTKWIGTEPEHVQHSIHYSSVLVEHSSACPVLHWATKQCVCDYQQRQSQPRRARWWAEGEGRGGLLNHVMANTSLDVGVFVPHPTVLTWEKERWMPPSGFILSSSPHLNPAYLPLGADCNCCLIGQIAILTL